MTWKALIGALIVLLTLPVVGACEMQWTEGICKDVEVWVDYAAGGADCRERKPGDPDCADGQIPRDHRPGRELDCVPNDISEPPYAAP